MKAKRLPFACRFTARYAAPTARAPGAYGSPTSGPVSVHVAASRACRQAFAAEDAAAEALTS